MISVIETFGIWVKECSVPGDGKFEVTGTFQPFEKRFEKAFW